MRYVGSLEQRVAHRHQHEECNEQADAAVLDEGSRKHDGEHGSLSAQTLGQILGDGLERTAGFHQFDEQRAKEKDREKLCDKAGCVAREGLRPVCQQRLACRERSNQGARGASRRLLQPR